MKIEVEDDLTGLLQTDFPPVRTVGLEGWSLIRLAIFSEKTGLVAMAVLDVPYFDGLKDPSGKTINLSSELNLLFSEAVPYNRGKIQAKLEELAKKR